MKLINSKINFYAIQFIIVLVTFSFCLLKINIISVKNEIKYFGWVHHAEIFNQTFYTEWEKVIAINNASIAMMRNMGLRAEGLKKKVISATRSGKGKIRIMQGL